MEEFTSVYRAGQSRNYVSNNWLIMENEGGGVNESLLVKSLNDYYADNVPDQLN